MEVKTYEDVAELYATTNVTQLEDESGDTMTLRPTDNGRIHIACPAGFTLSLRDVAPFCRAVRDAVKCSLELPEV